MTEKARGAPKINDLLDKKPRKVQIESPRGAGAENSKNESPQVIPQLNLTAGATTKGGLSDGIRHLKVQLERK